jgi:hypothetical protein
MHIGRPDLDRMFGALADHTRRDIVRRAIEGEEGVAELASVGPPAPGADRLTARKGTDLNDLRVRISVRQPIMNAPHGAVQLIIVAASPRSAPSSRALPNPLRG